MKKIFMIILLTFPMICLALDLSEETLSEDYQTPFVTEENYEAEMFMQREEDQAYSSTSDSLEDYVADEEVYNAESDYND